MPLERAIDPLGKKARGKKKPTQAARTVTQEDVRGVLEKLLAGKPVASKESLLAAAKKSLKVEQGLDLKGFTSEVPSLLPARHGKRLHMSTVYRWVLKGARGKVLDSAMLGGVRYTSLEALQRFMGTSPAELIEARRLARIRGTVD